MNIVVTLAPKIVVESLINGTTTMVLNRYRLGGIPKNKRISTSTMSPAAAITSGVYG